MTCGLSQAVSMVILMQIIAMQLPRRPPIGWPLIVKHRLHCTFKISWYGLYEKIKTQSVGCDSGFTLTGTWGTNMRYKHEVQTKIVCGNGMRLSMQGAALGKIFCYTHYDKGILIKCEWRIITKETTGVDVSKMTFFPVTQTWNLGY